MIALRILKEDDRVELIRGEIVAKMPIGDVHIAAVNRLNRILFQAVGDRATLSMQNPIRLIDSEPEPDVALLTPHDDDYASGKPGPSDLLLLIEIADSSLEDDRDVKGPLYAENGIADFWIVNLVDKYLEVRRQPRTDGTFAEVRSLGAGDVVDILALPGVSVPVADLLGK